MTDKYAETLDETKQFLKKIDCILKGICFVRFKNRLCENRDYEYTRLERCIDFHYLENKSLEKYNIFALTFLKNNLNELIHGTKFNDLYISEIKEPPLRTKKL